MFSINGANDLLSSRDKIIITCAHMYSYCLLCLLVYTGTEEGRSLKLLFGEFGRGGRQVVGMA